MFLIYFLNYFSLFFTSVLCLGLSSFSGNTGDALFVTPLINAGEIKEAKDNSYVKPMKDNIFSYAGFFTVVNNSQCESNMYFWFFPSKSGTLAPIVLSLQGKPGISSLKGVFDENGPFYVKPKRGLKLRTNSWIETMSVLYIDNPVGSGFSFTNNSSCYSKSDDDIANNLLVTIKQFFMLFPEYRNNSFFISGQSYGGKYIPALALKIDADNSKSTKKINLKGISIGNGFCDPVNMLSYGKYLYQIGSIDSDGLTAFMTTETKILNALQKKQFDQAFKLFDSLINGDVYQYKTLFNNLSNFNYYYNYLYPNYVSPYGDYTKFILSDLGRRSLHVGNSTFSSDVSKIEQYLINDIMQSAAPLIQTLLDKKYNVLIYSGELDIIVPYPLTIEFLKKLNWSGQRKYLIAKRELFKVKNQFAGYFKKADNLIELLVLDAGHMVSKDQPVSALEMITRFTYGKPF